MAQFQVGQQILLQVEFSPSDHHQIKVLVVVGKLGNLTTERGRFLNLLDWRSLQQHSERCLAVVTLRLNHRRLLDQIRH